jgi:transposase-like protein
VSVAQAGRDLDVHENVLRKWVKEFLGVHQTGSSSVLILAIHPARIADVQLAALALREEGETIVQPAPERPHIFSCFGIENASRVHA